MKRRLFTVSTFLVSVAMLALLVSGGALLIAAQSQPGSFTAPATAPDRASVFAAIRSTPLMFIETVGQVADGARFQVHGGSGTIHLADSTVPTMGFQATQYDDEFNGPTLNPRWSWYNENPGKWSLTALPGSLRIIGVLGDMAHTCNNPVNLLIQSAPSGDFELATRLSLNPTSNFQQGGLIVFNSADGQPDLDNYVKVDLLWSSYMGGKNVEFLWETQGALPSWPWPYFAVSQSQPAFLKLVKSGTLYTGYYSSDGQNWTKVGSHTITTISSPKMGIFALTGLGVPGCIVYSSSEITVDFDFFHCLGPAPTPTPTPTPTPEIAISHIEVTQAIQDENNSVPLIAGKPTFVRVYLDCGEGCTGMAGVTGVLHGYGPAGELPGSPRSSVNRSITAYHEESWPSQREALTKTLNFTLPSEWLNGTITLTAQVGSAVHNEIVPFQPTRSLRVAYIPIHYHACGYDRVPDMSAVMTARILAQELLPVGGSKPIDVEVWPKIYWPSSLKKDCKKLATVDNIDEVNVILLLEALEYQRSKLGGTNPPDYVFGWLPGGAFNRGIAGIGEGLNTIRFS